MDFYFYYHSLSIHIDHKRIPIYIPNPLSQTYRPLISISKKYHFLPNFLSPSIQRPTLRSHLFILQHKANNSANNNIPNLHASSLIREKNP